ncbi:MAG: prolipoprotein diacylglyceryl transferase [Desulfovibrio sp.]|jgi:phosphatidylglycerol:prolipoprotein diacylglycerol transferase|nr:prolipoprotein diacylglyceryl transferase [Desulfovibrio sp.]
MLSYPQLSPEAFRLGPLVVRWYGLMYLFGFIAAWRLGRLRSGPGRFLSRRQLEEAITWGMFGVVLGARLGYAFFYDPAFYLADPLRILQIWKGGMSFHGGLLGVLCALWMYARRQGLPFFALVDSAAPLVPPGLFFGRLGNFLNAELWGRVTDVPWGMVFPGAGPLPRHPSQLYEALLEGLVLFVLLWTFSAKKRPLYAVSGVFALGYSLFRVFGEFFRQPDAQLNYLAFGWVTMGMALCLPLLAAGLVLLWLAYGRPLKEERQKRLASERRAG